MLKRIVLMFTSAALVAVIGGCGVTETTASQSVGVAMPTTQSPRWVKDGDSVKLQLETLGYNVDLTFAEDDVAVQQQQIDTMINDGVDLLIVGSIDGTALSSQLERAQSLSIPVISYDRLIQNTEAVDYYASFDNARVGEQQGTSLLQGLGVLDAAGEAIAGAGPFNVELFAGSPDDNNAHVFYDGMMQVIQPYLDNGTLVVPSGQTDFDSIAIAAWNPETGGERMAKLLSSNKDTLDGVLSPYDGISVAIIEELKKAGYGSGAKKLPIVTGQDGELEAAQSVLNGEMHSTIFKDTRQLAEAAVLMGHAVLQGRTPEVNDTSSYDNGSKLVPSLLLAPQLVTQTNATQSLVDSGYYTAEELS
jgi:putative multiple sugar transport system substrate-binding protein